MKSSNSYFGHLFDYNGKWTKYFEPFVLIMQIENNRMGSALWYCYYSCNKPRQCNNTARFHLGDTWRLCVKCKQLAADCICKSFDKFGEINLFHFFNTNSIRAPIGRRFHFDTDIYERFWVSVSLVIYCMRWCFINYNLSIRYGSEINRLIPAMEVPHITRNKC